MRKQRIMSADEFSEFEHIRDPTVAIAMQADKRLAAELAPYTINVRRS